MKGLFLEGFIGSGLSTEMEICVSKSIRLAL